MKISFFKKKMILDESQYDFYKFEIDIIKLKKEKQKIKKYLASELVKIHPRISVQCKWEYFFTIEQKKLVANVIVVDKFLLAKYLKDMKQKFYIKNPRRRIFYPKEKMMLGMVFAFLVTIISCSFGVKQNINNEKEVENKSILEKTSSISQNNQEESQLDFELLTVFYEIIGNYLNIENQIYIEKIQYEKTDFQEKIDFTILGFFPEWIEDSFSKLNINKNSLICKIDSISYENKNPKIQGYFVKISNSLIKKQITSYIENPLVCFRNYLVIQDIYPELENQENISISFFIEKDSFARIMENYENKEIKNIKKLCVSSNFLENKILCEISFLNIENNETIGFSFQDFFSNELLKNISTKKIIEEKSVKQPEKETKDEYLDIVGQITLCSGEKITLIKDETGKILTVKNRE